MSRIGKQPIEIPQGVTVDIKDPSIPILAHILDPFEDGSGKHLWPPGVLRPFRARERHSGPRREDDPPWRRLRSRTASVSCGSRRG